MSIFACLPLLFDVFEYHKFKTYLIGRIPGGVLNFELGTDVRPEVSTTTLQQNQRRRKFATYIKTIRFLKGPFLKPISAFYNVNWDA